MIIIVSTICPIVASAVQGQALEKRTNLYTMALEKLNVMIGNLIHGYPTIKVNHVEREYLQTLEQDNEKAAHAEFAKSKTKVRVNMIIGLLSYAGEAVMVGFSIYEIAKGRLSVGALVGALQLSEMLVIPTNSISYQLSEMRSVASIRQKISRLLWPALYDRIGVVLQDAFLFDDTLLQNITLYRPELRECAEPVLRSLGMDAFLASHDLEQTFQNTKGNLSGGERQKLALARVLIENKSVIFLDEATANMDKDSSQKILSQLLRTAGLTVISIEHKVSPELLPLYDQILELKDTHLVESV